MKKGQWLDILNEIYDEKRPYAFALKFEGQIFKPVGKFSSYEEALSAAKEKARNLEGEDLVGYVIVNTRISLENLLREYKIRDPPLAIDEPPDRTIIED